MRIYKGTNRCKRVIRQLQDNGCSRTRLVSRVCVCVLKKVLAAIFCRTQDDERYIGCSTSTAGGRRRGSGRSRAGRLLLGSCRRCRGWSRALLFCCSSLTSGSASRLLPTSAARARSGFATERTSKQTTVISFFTKFCACV